MNATLVKDFQGRIINATQEDLIVINYEMLLAEIDDAIVHVDEADKRQFTKSMTSAHRMLRELSDNLDFQYEISRDLMSLYIYVSKKLIDASITHKKEDLEEIRSVLKILLTGWQQAVNNHTTTQGAVIQNAQKVYAGLTYGKGSLNETVYQDNSRGFRA